MRKLIFLSLLFILPIQVRAQFLSYNAYKIRYGSFDQTHGFTLKGYAGTLHILNYAMSDSINVYAKTYFGIGVNVQSVVFSSSMTGSGDYNTNGHIIFGADRDIKENTSDASDNRRLRVTAGGGPVDSRGAVIELYGNEHTNTGQLIFKAGNVGGGDISFWTNGAKHWTIRQDSSDALYSDAAIVLGSPTGGYKGVGTINAVAVYDDNTLLTDKVYEPGYKYLSIRETERYYKNFKHLPTIDGRDSWEKNGKPSLGKLVSQLWETIEIQQLHITELQNQIDKLQNKIGKLK